MIDLVLVHVPGFGDCFYESVCVYMKVYGMTHAGLSIDDIRMGTAQVLDQHRIDNKPITEFDREGRFLTDTIVTDKHIFEALGSGCYADDVQVMAASEFLQVSSFFT